MKTFFLTLMLGVTCVSLSARADAVADEIPAFNDSPLPYLAIGAGCAVIGAPTCMLIWHDDDDGFRTTRAKADYGVQLGYFPSYVLDLAESTAFQRVEASAFSGNALIALSHRRGVQEPNVFSSTSYRLAYSFDWRHVRPAIGLGVRRNVNARNGNALELWLPVFANRSLLGEDSFSMFFETLWVFGPDGVRPEIQARFEYGLWKNASLAVSLGYFADYHNPEAELSIGPIGFF